MAYDLNMPMSVYEGKAGDGSLPENFSMISCNRDNVILETVKESEDGEDLILRMYETKNMRTKLKLTLGFHAKSASVCNLMENEISDLSLNGRELELTVQPFEIVTLRIKR
jgi:alpha-mannosidase